MSGPLHGLRILELCDETGSFAGKLLGDAGADVVKLEPPGGERSRHVPPFAGDIEDLNRSLYFWSRNTSKRSLAADISVEQGAALAIELMARADIVLESAPPGALAAQGLGYDLVAARNPGVIYVSITPFGQTGPWSAFQATDLVSLALGGQMAMCGYHDVPDAPPIRGGGDQAYLLGPIIAVAGALAALHERMRSGRGQHVDASTHEALSASTELGNVAYLYSGRVLIRQTGRHASGRITETWQHRCADGEFVNLFGMPRSARDWLELVAWLDSHGTAEDLASERYHSPRARQLNAGRPEAAHCMDVLARFAATLPAEEVYHGGQQRGATWAPVRSPEANLHDPHFAEDRRFFVEPPDNDTPGALYPDIPCHFSASPGGIQRRPPRFAEHTREVLREWLALSDDAIDAFTASGAAVEERARPT